MDGGGENAGAKLQIDAAVLRQLAEAEAARAEKQGGGEMQGRIADSIERIVEQVTANLVVCRWRSVPFMSFSCLTVVASSAGYSVSDFALLQAKKLAEEQDGKGADKTLGEQVDMSNRRTGHELC